MTPGRLISDMGHTPVQEDVLEVATVGLQPHQAQAELGGDVADQVVRGSFAGQLRRWWVDRDHGAAGTAGESAPGERLAEEVALGLGADDLDEEAPGVLEEVPGGAGAQQAAAVEDDDVVADLLELTQQVGGDQ